MTDTAQIDPRRVVLDALFEGTYVLCTNTRLTPFQAALRYRERWMVEDIFRTAKALLATRPIEGLPVGADARVPDEPFSGCVSTISYGNSNPLKS